MYTNIRCSFLSYIYLLKKFLINITNMNQQLTVNKNDNLYLCVFAPTILLI